MRLLVLGILLTACLTLVGSNSYFSRQFTETTRNRAEVRLALYTGSLTAELKRASVVPELLSRDPALIGALNSSDYTGSTQRLLSFVEEIGAASLFLMDADGRTVATTVRESLGLDRSEAADFTAALGGETVVFTASRKESGAFGFYYSKAVRSGATDIGVVSVEVDLAKLAQSWASTPDAVMVLDGDGQIILATSSDWIGVVEEEALVRRSAPSAIERAIRATQDWAALPVDAYLRGEAVLRSSGTIDDTGWQIVSFTTYSSVRERVTAVLALEIMGFALLLTVVFWLSNRRSEVVMRLFERESVDLRRLNRRLQREITEREKIEKDLEVAEQTIAQSSKLAALGEMSAAVSHELNQPLAAMKTYLAGARLLVSRKRPDEALASFQRIDDLIERMGAITKQLKSYARKGAESFEPVDVRAAVTASLALMEPQFKARSVTLNRTLPHNPVMISGDRLRLEQVIINLVRNALDATKGRDNPTIEILLAEGETVTLSVQDNGPGIEDLKNLWEPFYTTKDPGDGVGLGLAISWGIITDFGGQMVARNPAKGGATFEIRLPILGAEPLIEPPVVIDPLDGLTDGEDTGEDRDNEDKTLPPGTITAAE